MEAEEGRPTMEGKLGGEEEMEEGKKDEGDYEKLVGWHQKLVE